MAKEQPITTNRQGPALDNNTPGVFVRHPYQMGDKVAGISEWGTGRTQQSFKAECDINNILKKYQKTGAITHVNNYGEEYSFASSDDYHSSINKIIKADEMFAALPSSLRNKFDGSPAKFLDFVQDETNKAEMADLGLLKPGAYTPPAEPVLPVATPEPSTDP